MRNRTECLSIIEGGIVEIETLRSLEIGKAQSNKLVGADW
jgi:hypothetical protein